MIYEVRCGPSQAECPSVDRFQSSRGSALGPRRRPKSYINHLTSNYPAPDSVCQENPPSEIVSLRSRNRLFAGPGLIKPMALNLPETTSKLEGALVKQFSVF